MSSKPCTPPGPTVRFSDDKKCLGCELDHRRWFIIRLCDTRRHVRYETLRVVPAYFYATTTARPVRCRVDDKFDCQGSQATAAHAPADQSHAG
jgi:hypothetical protein